ncbi:hypothetical protein BJP25_21975 [Actinokineospora bangkokensis]|uniref:Uncharacterized protein n=1 Tax=Actinokineospora bangkokensis TaxID=1193682 RepID=A0A1Q9LL27_9PSEU|nr:hypothetical protein BJP25_21975 [Actinokineospora bangkokensis]
MAVSDVVAEIDAVMGCQQCGGPLGDSPSGDFCGQACASLWAAQRTGARPGDVAAAFPALAQAAREISAALRGDAAGGQIVWRGDDE